MSELVTQPITTQLSIDMPSGDLLAHLATMEKLTKQAARRTLGQQAIDLHSVLLQQSLMLEAESGLVEPIEIPEALIRPDITSSEVQCEMALQRRSANRQIGNIAGVLSIVERDAGAPEWGRRLLSQL